MKKMLFFILVLLVAFSGSMFAQVIADFEEGTNDFFDNGWGPGFTSVSQVADPSGLSDGVLALEYNGDGKGVIQKSNVPTLGGQVLTYFMYLPGDVPDSISFKLWAQDNNTWSWTELVYYAYEIPKEVWFPINYNMEAMTADTNISFNCHDYDIGKMGVEIAMWDEHDADTNWTGTMYIDNVSIIGAEPVVFADFEITESGFADNGWGPGFTSVSQVADPTGLSDGVLALEYNSTGKGVIQKDNVTPSGQVISYSIFLEDEVPDSISFKLWAQDANTWSWTEVVWYAYEIPRGVWYPITYDMEAMFIDPDISFNHHDYDIGKMGIEVANWDEHDADTSWIGTIYVDNGVFLGTETGWVLADYESEAAVPYFTVGGWGSENNGISVFERIADPTGNSDGVLLSTWNFIADSTNTKDAFSAAPVDLEWTETEQGATAISIDIYVPATFPAGINIEMWAQAHDWAWNSWAFPVSDSTEVVPGEWSTMTVDLVANAEALKLAEDDPKYFGVQINSTVDWGGDIYFDNYTIFGIEEPEAVLHTPALLGSVTDTTFTTGLPVQNSRLTWDDSDQSGLETFDIYMSESAITDITADGVIRIGTDVPHGTGAWNHRPWTGDGGAKTLYYAIIAKQAGESTELTTEGTVGPLEFTATSIPAHATYDPNFSNVFELNGMDDEFTEEYKEHMMVPEGASGDSSAGWSLESSDVMYHNTFVFDDDYLYISADVTDDYVWSEDDEDSQAWMGDALEFFIGVYDIRELSAYHTKGSSGAEGTGDHRISFTSYGTLELSGYIVVPTYPGIESVVYTKWGGDGYIIEARFALDSLAMGGEIDVVEGMMFPLRIDNTDRDFGDASRTLLAGWGGSSGSDGGNPENWLRPSCWGYLMVGDTVITGVAADNGLPKKFKLHANYPNPFNPITNLKFDIPKYSKVSLVIYDMLGNEVKTIVNDKRSAGTYNVKWDGTNDFGVNVTSGVYFCKFTTSDYVTTQKMLLIK